MGYSFGDGAIYSNMEDYDFGIPANWIGDKVKCEVDWEAGTVRFSVNDKDQGIAFTGEIITNNQFYFAFSMGRGESQLEIVDDNNQFSSF